MKKLLSLLIATVMATSLFATTAFAATANVSADFSATEVNVGDTFTLTINSAEKTIYAEDVRLKYDLSKFEIVSKKGVYQGNEAPDTFVLTQPGAFGASAFAVDFNPLSTGDGYSWSKLIGSATKFSACTLAKIEMKALEAGTFTFTLEEYSGYSDASDHTGFDGVAGTYTVTVKGGEPDAPVVGEPENEGDNAKVWAVTVAGDYVATKNGALKATLTNPDVTEDKTQEVTLNVNGIAGEATWTFDVRVTFQNPVYRNNTTLAVN